MLRRKKMLVVAAKAVFRATAEPLEIRCLLSAPVVGSFQADAPSPITIGQIVSLTASATDPDSGDLVNKVDFYEDANGSGSGEEAELIASDFDESDSWRIEWDTKFHVGGQVKLLAVAEDSNKERSEPKVLTVTLNTPPPNQAPVVNSLTANPPSPVLVGQKVTLTATATDPDTGDQISKMKFYEDANANGNADIDELLETDLNGSDGWIFSWNTAGHAAGSVTLLAVAFDSSDTSSAPKSIAMVLSSLPVNHAPVVSVFQASPPSPIQVGQIVSLTATVSDSDGGDTVSRVRFYKDLNQNGLADGGEILGTDFDASDGWGLAWNTTGYAAGSISLLAVAFDSSNTSSIPRSLSITIVPVDATPPQIASWASANDHARAVGEAAVAIPDDGTFSEPRDGGIYRLLVVFTEAINPLSFGASSIKFAGNDVTGAALNLSGIGVTTSTRGGGTVGVVQFGQPLPDYARYLIRLVGVTDAAGNALGGDNDIVLTALKGDVSGDRRVNVTDLSYISARYSDPITSDVGQTRADVNMDGRANVTDLSRVWARVNNDARFIPDPVLPAGVSPVVASAATSRVASGTPVTEATPAPTAVVPLAVRHSPAAARKPLAPVVRHQVSYPFAKTSLAHPNRAGGVLNKDRDVLTGEARA